MDQRTATASARIPIVGATGFLGAKILRLLAATSIQPLRAMSRRGAPSGASGTVEWKRGDLMDPDSLEVVLRGVDVVIRSANGYMKETIAADFQGDRNLIGASAKAGVKWFVFLSILGCDTAADVPHFHAKAVAGIIGKVIGKRLRVLSAR